MDTLEILVRFLDNEGFLGLLGGCENGAVVGFVGFGFSPSCLLWAEVKRAGFGFVSKEGVND